MSLNRADRGSWLVVALAVVVGFGTAAWAAAQTASCKTLCPQACTPAFGDAGRFSTGFLCYATKVVQAGIMPGCGGDMFCPQGLVTRADMAVFLENAKHYSSSNCVPYQLPTATGIFADVPASFPLACWIEQFYNDGITAGCGAGPPPTYCPDSAVTRAQMAVFILRTKGVNPAPCTQIFNDVPCSSPYAIWINELYNECITAGCSVPPSPPLYCPDNSITREQMGVFLWRAFLTSSPCTASCT